MSPDDASNRLPVLAGEITTAIAAMRRDAVSAANRALQVGHALIEAKAAVSHGAWERWLSDNVSLSARSARGYMQLARSGMKAATVAALGVRMSLESAAAMKPRAQGPMPTIHLPASLQVGLASEAERHVFLVPVVDAYHFAIFGDDLLHTKRPIYEDGLPIMLRHLGFTGALNFTEVSEHFPPDWLLRIIGGESISSPAMLQVLDDHRTWREAVLTERTEQWTANRRPEA